MGFLVTPITHIIQHPVFFVKIWPNVVLLSMIFDNFYSIGGLIFVE